MQFIVLMLSGKIDIMVIFMESTLAILLCIGAAQGFLLSVALFSIKRGNTTANRILAVLLISFSILIFFHTMGHYHNQPHAPGRHTWLIHAVLFFAAPLLFFYTKALTEFGFRIRFRYSIHIVPPLVAVVAALLLEAFFRKEEYSRYIGGIFVFFLALQVIAYLIRMLFILHNHARNIQNTFSSLEKINLRWLRIFVISQTVIWPVAGFIDFQKADTSDVGFAWLVVSIFMYVTGYFGIRQPEIFSGDLQAEDSVSQGKKKKYEKSTLSPGQADVILQKLKEYMGSSKPYLLPTLTLPELSKPLNISSHHLSQIINERLAKNFFEFINSYRIEEAKRLLKDSRCRHLTLAAIGYEAGFNSVSSFNSVFKKATSFTPSEYQSSTVPEIDD